MIDRLLNTNSLCYHTEQSENSSELRLAQEGGNTTAAYRMRLTGVLAYLLDLLAIKYRHIA